MGLLCLLVAPSPAGAADYTVNSTGDQADSSVGAGGCLTTGGTCTLRAAIEESNASAGVIDEIDFDWSFDGQFGDTVELGSPLPTLADRVRINGFQSPMQCETDYFAVPGPCTGINGPPTGPAFRVATDRVVLVGFAIANAETAIEVVDGPGLQAWNMWFGLRLDGSAGPLETGVSLDQDSDGALLGAAASVGRNIWAHNTEVGLDVKGADALVVRGSGFGIMPDGNSAAPNGTNIEISDAPSGDNRVARGNWIGGMLDDEQLRSTTCDGACNVISGATESGIDLAGDGPGERPASGSTRIVGNFIGLNAFGTTGIANAQQGVLVGSAENVSIGGPRPGERNLINGGAAGVLAGPNPGNLRIEENWIGLDSTGANALAAPAIAGISVASGYQVAITGNRISMPSGTAIDLGAQEAAIRLNAIGRGSGGEDLPGGTVGVHLHGPCGYYCTLVAGNSIAHATNYGVLIENSRNQIHGNRIEASGLAGVRVSYPPPFGVAGGNEIGGDDATEENTISGSGGAAIEIVEFAGLLLGNQVARNHGTLNGGPFIDLQDAAEAEIAPPGFATSTQSGASGDDAEPAAVIRVFRKAGSSPGEIAGFLAETVADGYGDWAVAYSGPIPAGTVVAASQSTHEAGTSELSFATAAAEQTGSGGGTGDGGSGGSPPVEPPVTPRPPAPDRTPPETTILSGPAKRSPSRTARFRFLASEGVSRFRCRLSGTVSACESPQTYRRLAPGKHVFEVWATDPAGNRDRSPAKWTFRVLAPSAR